MDMGGVGYPLEGAGEHVNGGDVAQRLFLSDFGAAKAVEIDYRRSNRP